MKQRRQVGEKVWAVYCDEPGKKYDGEVIAVDEEKATIRWTLNGVESHIDYECP